MKIFVNKEKNRLNSTQIKYPLNQRTKVSKLLLCKCSTINKKFCIRLDRKIDETNWHMAYSFPFHSTMENEDFTSSSKESIVIIDRLPEFSGCPFCKNTAMCFCACGSVFCAKGDGTGIQTCPICGLTDTYKSSSKFDVKSGAH